MSTKKVEDDSCVIQCNPHRELACGYTKVKIMPNNYSKIILIAGMTGKSIQEVTNELLEYAISKTVVQSDDNFISISDLKGE